MKYIVIYDYVTVDSWGKEKIDKIMREYTTKEQAIEEIRYIKLPSLGNTNIRMFESTEIDTSAIDGYTIEQISSMHNK